MNEVPLVLDVVEDPTIRRHQIAHRLTSVERRLMRHFASRRQLVVCIGNIGAGKSSLVKLLAFNTGMNALFELPDEGFEDHILSDSALWPLLATAKQTVKRTLSEYYGAIDGFIEAQKRHPEGSPDWVSARHAVEKGALGIQHAYLDLRRMQLLAFPSLQHSTCIDGSPLADRYAFCEVLHRDLDISYLTADALDVIDRRLDGEFRGLARPDLLVYLHAPLDYLFQNIRERARSEEKDGVVLAADEGVPEGLARLVRALNVRYERFVKVLRDTGWYDGPVLRIDVSRVDFVSNVRHLIAVYEGLERLLAPGEQLGLFS
ncbi:MAG: deoxynucleoside kinase [Deltaproteobacteria bacterium]|nr:deoxynucleoside kinase [Deltaproteobacteria bacterium]